MVLGNTPEAARVSHELLHLGYLVHWISAEPMAPQAPSGRLTLHPECDLVRLDGHVGGFVARLQHGEQAFSIHASAIVVATGIDRCFSIESYNLGSIAASRVLSTAQAQQQLAEPRSTGPALEHRHERIAMVLDLGQLTGKQMTAESLRLALALREQWHAEVSVLYRELKVDTYGLEALTRDMRERGIVFCRYDNPQIHFGDDGVYIGYVEGTLQAHLLVLPEATRPREDAPELAAILRVRLGNDGFFQNVNIHEHRPGLSERRGIFFAGSCHLDATPEELVADAAQAAANVDALLGSGYIEPEEIIAHVNSAECIRCLTCVRTCPHAAIEVVSEDSVTAARVVDCACRGCGACVVNCPVHAIELPHYPLPSWMAWRQGIAL